MNQLQSLCLNGHHTSRFKVLLLPVGSVDGIDVVVLAAEQLVVVIFKLVQVKGCVV